MSNFPIQENELLEQEIKTALFNPIIRMVRIKCLPDQLGLEDIATLLTYHRRNEPSPAFMRFDVFGIQSGFIEHINQQIECGRIPIEGRTERRLSLWKNAFNPQNGIFEPILSRKTIKTCLEIMDLWPLEEGCLLANWWPGSSNHSDKGGDNNYDKRKEAFNDWLKQSQPNTLITKLMEVTKEEAFNSVKKLNPGLWPDKFSSFSKDFWQKYTEEETGTGIKGHIKARKTKNKS